MAAFGDTPTNEVYEQLRDVMEEHNMTPIQAVNLLAQIMIYISEGED